MRVDLLIYTEIFKFPKVAKARNIDAQAVDATLNKVIIVCTFLVLIWL